LLHKVSGGCGRGDGVQERKANAGTMYPTRGLNVVWVGKKGGELGRGKVGLKLPLKNLRVAGPGKV